MLPVIDPILLDPICDTISSRIIPQNNIPLAVRTWMEIRIVNELCRNETNLSLIHIHIAIILFALISIGLILND